MIVSLWLIFSVVVLAVVPNRFQALPIDLIGFRIARNAVAVVTLLLLVLALALGRRHFLIPSGRRARISIVAAITPVALWIVILGDSFVRPIDIGPNKIIQLGIILLGISFFVAQRSRFFPPNIVPAVVIGLVLAVNWADQILTEVSYGSGANLRFGWSLALSLLCLIPGKAKHFIWGHFLLNHFVSWLALLFLFQADLRSPYLVAFIVVTVQSFFWTLAVLDKFSLSLLQFAVGILAWRQLSERPIFVAGELQTTGRKELLGALGSAQQTSFFFGDGLGSARLLTEARLSLTPHNIWAELWVDAGLFGVVVVATVIAIVLVDALSRAGGSGCHLKRILSHEVMFRGLAFFCFGLIGAFNDILDETTPSILFLIVMFVRPGRLEGFPPAPLPSNARFRPKF